MKVLSAALLLGAGACAAAAPAVHGQPLAAVQVDHAWVQPVPTGRPETWGFATITNPGPGDTVVEVRTPDAASVVLRATTVTDAGRKMRSVASIPVPARGTLVLSVDTYFISFIHPRHAFATGETITGTMRFSSGALVPVTFVVGEAAGDPKDGLN